MHYLNKRQHLLGEAGSEIRLQQTAAPFVAVTVAIVNHATTPASFV